MVQCGHGLFSTLTITLVIFGGIFVNCDYGQQYMYLGDSEYPESSRYEENNDYNEFMYDKLAKAFNNEPNSQPDEDLETPEPNDLKNLYLNEKTVNSMYKAPSSAGGSNKEPSVRHRTYCNPPNPCPKGFTPEANGCEAGVVDTAVWNRLRQEDNMRSGVCACDVEHMQTCPPGVPTVSVAAAKQASQQMNQQNTGQHTAAKKSPDLARNKREADDVMDFNVDDHKVVAKKSPGFA